MIRLTEESLSGAKRSGVAALGRGMEKEACALCQESAPRRDRGVRVDEAWSPWAGVGSWERDSSAGTAVPLTRSGHTVLASVPAAPDSTRPHVFTVGPTVEGRPKEDSKAEWPPAAHWFG